MAAKVTPSTPGAPSFSWASAYAARRVSNLQTWTYKPQKRQDVSAFALTYSLRLRSCKSMDAFIISSLPSRLRETLQTEGPPRSAGIILYQRSSAPTHVGPLAQADGLDGVGHCHEVVPGLAGSIDDGVVIFE